MKKILPALSCLLLSACVIACGSDGASLDPRDAGVEDAGLEDAGLEDAGLEDAGLEDAGGQDAGGQDAGGEDAGLEDAGGEDAGGEDAGGEDAGGEDAGGEEPVDCSGIAANAAYELCDSSDSHCEGVFTDASGCTAYCAAAGLVCTERYGGEPGCQLEVNNPIDCAADNGHGSDWCVCRRGEITNPECAPDPGDPPTYHELSYAHGSVVWNPRSSWVLQCRDYAYTAQFAEHEACDSLYQAGSGRGTASFSFNVPRGQYDVSIEGRHTENRNPAGMRVVVSSAGANHVVFIDQRDDAGLVSDLHGRYCLDGSVTVLIDSSVSAASDSVRRVILDPVD